MKIGVLGLMNSGKDTFAQMLLEHLDGFSIDRYAAPIKDLTCRVFNLTDVQVEDRVLKEQVQPVHQDIMIEEVLHTLTKVLKFTPEQLEQASELYFEHLGHCTELSPRKFQQLIGTDVVRAVQDDAWVQRLQKVQKNLIVPDVRFENELCDYNILIMREHYTEKPTHSSELFAWLIENRTVYPTTIVDGYVDNVKGTTLEHLRWLAKVHTHQITKQL